MNKWDTILIRFCPVVLIQTCECSCYLIFMEGGVERWMFRFFFLWLLAYICICMLHIYICMTYIYANIHRTKDLSYTYDSPTKSGILDKIWLLSSIAVIEPKKVLIFFFTCVYFLILKANFYHTLNIPKVPGAKKQTIWLKIKLQPGPLLPAEFIRIPTHFFITTLVWGRNLTKEIMCGAGPVVQMVGAPCS